MLNNLNKQKMQFGLCNVMNHPELQNPYLKSNTILFILGSKEIRRKENCQIVVTMLSEMCYLVHRDSCKHDLQLVNIYSYFPNQLT